ncbi:MAG: transposase [Polyangiaceae bacterium]|nr:transposase [Polyangiaceae bacterium]
MSVQHVRLAAGAGVAHAAHAAREHERHRPEETVLYQVIEEHWGEFVERAEEHGGLPRFVLTEVEEYLRCGRLEHGLLRLACTQCGHERLCAFSCKRRGFCPSCLGRRMTDAALDLVERVLPWGVPIRQWVCSLPWRLRVLCGYDRALCADVVRAFTEEVRRSLRRRAKDELGLASLADAHTGSVAFVQRFDSALRLNVHVHSLFLDGVYVRDERTEELVFHPLPEPTAGEVAEVAERTAKRLQKVLVKHGRALDPELVDVDVEHASPESDHPALDACYGAAAQGIDLLGARAGRPTLRLVDPSQVRPHEPAAIVMGVNVHAKVAVDGRDRPRLERLCRYLGRPPIAQERLSRLPDGRVRYDMKKAWRDGTKAVVLEPLDLIARVLAMIPPPRFHMVRYYGVLSSHSALRSEVVPRAPASPENPVAADGCVQLELRFEGGDDEDEAPRRRRPWAWMLRHVFQNDVSICARCGGAMRWLEVATTSEAIARAMADHGLGPRPPPRREWVPFGQLTLGFG